MKRIILSIVIIFISSFGKAQSPDFMSYQAVIRNSAGDLLNEKPVGIRFSILHKTDAGVGVFTETQAAITNKNGLVSVKIGAGTILSGNISTIDWSDGPYFIKTETDPKGGTAYSIINTSQMLAIPYAYYATNSGNAWALTGNSVTGKNFLGTTNNQPLVFKVNNNRVGFSDGTSNIFWGRESGVLNTGDSNSA
ncbi:MAG: hypothetical protein ABI266_07915, partial [Ginsengibacter sp.]